MRAVIGAFFLWTSGIHVGTAAIDPSSYQHFADAAVMAWVERGWNEIFMANPRVWGLAVAAGELILGLLLLRGGGAASRDLFGKGSVPLDAESCDVVHPPEPTLSTSPLHHLHQPGQSQPERRKARYSARQVPAMRVRTAK